GNGAASDRRRVDEHVPRVGGRRPLAGVRANSGCDFGRSIMTTGRDGDMGAFPHEAERGCARGATSAEDGRTRTAKRGSFAKRLEEAFDVGVGARPTAVGYEDRVD